VTDIEIYQARGLDAASLGQTIVLPQNFTQSVVRQAMNGIAVYAFHRLCREESVNDRFFGGMGGSPEKEVDLFVWQHREVCDAVIFACFGGIRRREGDEDIAGRILATSSHVADTERYAFYESLELVR